ncbi:MAG: hypothetical protein HYS08_05960 [Chlamydiae bacterium]|nr:hypothetical protein [Chlamydiota bacterium]MBI3266437.1 hypothetical protein [Chlamydiota bacterium]
MKKRNGSFVRDHFSLDVGHDQLLSFLNTTPQNRLTWLEEVNDFLLQTMSKAKLSLWEKARGERGK